MSERNWTRQLLEQKEKLDKYWVTVKAARKLVAIHQQGQPGVPGTRYPMSHAQLIAWSAEWRSCMEELVQSLHD